MGAVAVLTARGGSKGLPGKNLMLLGDESLLARSIRTAQRSATVTRLIVSTEDRQIAAEAERCDCECLMRPPEMAADHTLPDPAILWTLDTLGLEPDVVVRLNCTAPFTTSGDIDRCVRAIRAHHYRRSAVTVVPFNHYLVSDAGNLINRNGETCRQEFRQQWMLNGGVSAGPLGTLRRFANVVDWRRDCGPIPVPAEFRWACEIDTAEDFAHAEKLLDLTHR